MEYIVVCQKSDLLFSVSPVYSVRHSSAAVSDLDKIISQKLCAKIVEG